MIRILFGASLIFLAACSSKPETQEQEVLKIVTTTGMIQDAVKNITGVHAQVEALMGPGVDPHLYKATQGDLKKLTEADVVFYNGLHLEGKMGEVLEKLSRTKPVLAVAASLPDSILLEVEGFEGITDPHIWFDVKLWREAVQTIHTYMVEIDSTHKAYYDSAAHAYTMQLDSLHGAVSAQLLTIPEEQRVLITAHDAFGYFGRAYNIQVRGLQGISTVAEFGLRDVTELVDFIIERKIKAIFVESSISPKSIQAVEEGCRKKNWQVKIGGNLYSDAMGDPGTPEGTYIGMVNANVKTIVEALK
ncbi:MAG: zinc ABC transporter substrate-binding protein [Cyclobacteriaceae bacterium]|nr:MAG: zinc ABC transporter substrate-binding protein [Cyclobacteriaceae bacterium]